jgi:negative regulator of flagellin synthesis FlgM
MKIDKTPHSAPAAAVAADRQDVRTARGQVSSPTGVVGDTVSLSSDAQVLGSSLAEPAFDAAKVEAVKAAIANGTFKVDTDRVAAGLISSVTEMLARKAN